MGNQQPSASNGEGSTTIRLRGVGHCVRSTVYLKEKSHGKDIVYSPVKAGVERKIDVGIIGVKVPPDELDAIKPIREVRGISRPNIVLDIYKNRRGQMCDVKIFRYFDYGTCRARDLFVTDANYQLLDYSVLKCPPEEIDLVKYENELQRNAG